MLERCRPRFNPSAERCACEDRGRLIGDQVEPPRRPLTCGAALRLTAVTRRVGRFGHGQAWSRFLVTALLVDVEPGEAPRGGEALPTRLPVPDARCDLRGRGEGGNRTPSPSLPRPPETAPPEGCRSALPSLTDVLPGPLLAAVARGVPGRVVQWNGTGHPTSPRSRLTCDKWLKWRSGGRRRGGRDPVSAGVGLLAAAPLTSVSHHGGRLSGASHPRRTRRCQAISARTRSRSSPPDR